MTTQEAIEIIKKDGWGYSETMHTEAVMMAIDALEKQIPRELTDKGCCPLCGEYLDHEIFFIADVNYCPVCGQAFKWSEVEG